MNEKRGASTKCWVIFGRPLRGLIIVTTKQRILTHLRVATVIALAYLLGSIPFGYLIVRAHAGADIRETGSGGTGATNVSRRAGKTAGVLTLLLDALKGAAAILIARLIIGQPILEVVEDGSWLIAAAAILVIIGHMYPVWLGFRGGKGVATAIGVFLVLAPLALFAAGIVFGLVVAVTRYVSLASMTAASTLPVFIWLQHGMIRPVDAFWPTLFAAVLIAALIVIAHRDNIERLSQGTESKFE
ncbi:MAG TPA: glycerol-3-phosphate 1-O-acyltransferase PlsY [Pyrinomonadaceae bacterium]|nr:glycerol-3-phosphate 1-O-acyltransferase PlsY [Pyrinomonadaceae bacterium]